MGGASSLWYGKNKRKILILTFEEENLDILSKCLLKKTIKINEHFGFACENFKYEKLDLRLWFLTCKNRHLWRHHYFGAQGVILIYKFKDIKKGEQLLIETLNIFTDSILSQIPILVLFDSSDEEMEKLNETFRNKLNTLCKSFINTQHINFKIRIGDFKFGLDWLCEVMKPIIA